MDKEIQMGNDLEITDEMREEFHLNEDPESEEPLRMPVQWRHLFPESVIEQASSEEMQSKLKMAKVWLGISAEYYPDEKEKKAARLSKKPRQSYYYDSYYTISIHPWPPQVGKGLKPSHMTCNCPEGRMDRLCSHKAAFLYKIEQQKGGLLVAVEDEYTSGARIGAVKVKKKHQEQARLREMYGSAPCPALDFFEGRRDPDGIAVYDMRTALKDYVTDPYSIHMAKDILKNHPKSFYFHAFERKERDGTRTFEAELNEYDSLSNYYFKTGSARLTGSKLHLRTSEGYLDGETRLKNLWEKGFEEENRFENDPNGYSDGDGQGGSGGATDGRSRAKNYLNINGLILCELLWDETDKLAEETADLTDEKAIKFFKSLEKANKAAAQKADALEPTRMKAVELYPRIIIEDGMAKLSFRIQKVGGKVIVVRNVRELVAACTGRYTLTLSKTESIDFGEYDFTDHSARLYDFLQRKVGDVSDINMQFEMRNMRSSHSFRTINVTSSLEFQGAVLDNFYDAWEGQSAEYQDKTNGVASKEIPVAHRDIRLSLTCDRLSDARGTFSGIAVHGLIPVLLHGSGSHRYTLNADGLSRITKKEQEIIKPFDAVADASGYFRFQVGLPNLQEFYYRVVPAFLENPSVDFTDHCEKEAEGYLPPEPQFDFYLDCETPDVSAYSGSRTDKAGGKRLEAIHFMRCTGKVRYREKSRKGQEAAANGGSTNHSGNERNAGNLVYAGNTVNIENIENTEDSENLVNTGNTENKEDTGNLVNAGNTGNKENTENLVNAGNIGNPGNAEKVYTLGISAANDGYRDIEQEKRAVSAVRSFMMGKPDDDGVFSTVFNDEQLFDFLQSGIAVLEKYGTVHGSEAFRKFTVAPVPKVKVGVSVDSGILDLSLTSSGISEEELLEVLQSYRQRKRFHVLSSGDFLDLAEDDQLTEISDFMQELDLNPEDVIKKSAKMPLYRALYIDRLLEQHDALYSTRDRVYRSIIRNFKTIRDSESEPPVALAGTLRPYQTLGFKWIRTLEEAGFGGILADEMGLGKTLQTIAALLYDYEEKKPGTEHPSMVVCPASLVYNWQEEFEKFAPDIRVVPVAGGAAARKKAFAAWDTTQVYVISYDLLKRNVAELSGKTFFYVILDEAQYIKNSGAAVSKAVKTLNARHRLALTGTPIENRLSELWSIFDFLMPGFLYAQKEFEQRFAVPVTKNKDQQAIEKLKTMTSPFLMRRRKEDVLKDLPAKLEEVRYVPISGEQQKLYDAEVLKLKQSISDGMMGTGTGKVKVLAELTRIREICCDPSLLFENYHKESAKREAVMGLIRQAMDGGHRMLLFSQFTSMLALLEEDLKAEGIPYYILTGSTSKEKRIQLVHQFNEGDVPVFLISLKAGGNGLNLTGADIVIHYDPWWNQAAQNQATDRAHRIGQTRQVTVYRLIMKGTIEERILRLQEEKKDLADQVLSGESTSLASLSQAELLELLS
ncbi:MAG: DEAD/DEAH box helicase [Lachnospiraceae bacterium]|nr:DEAD/DEAH box helicase [Lachnospiraceae bacterium]